MKVHTIEDEVRKIPLRIPQKYKNWRTQLELQSMVLPGIIFLFIFAYIPMLFAVIAFQDYNIVKGIEGSPWVGLKYFAKIFNDSSFFNVMRNTFGINLLGLAIGFPTPIILALLLNELRNEPFKKFVQTSTYLPYFFSWAVYGGIVLNFLSPSVGLINGILKSLGLIDKGINFIGTPEYFWWIVVISGLVKGIGFSSIIYLAAIAGVDQALCEAAKVDGANRFQVIRHITIPSIMGTIVIMLILAVAGILNTGPEQILILQNVMNLKMSETLDTYVYKMGLQQMNFSYATAVGLFKATVAVTLLAGTNYFSKKITEKGLF